MLMKNKKSSYGARMPLAVTLIVAAFASAFFISTYSNKGDDYWVVSTPITPGHVISYSDLSLSHLNLGDSADKYMSAQDEPIGMVVTRQMAIGEVISILDLTTTDNAMSTSAVPISMRSVDIAEGIIIGESVDIYWVFDSRNGEPVIDPILILGGTTVLSVEGSMNSLGGDIGITIAVEETQVLRLLSATTQGRLVVVKSRV